MNETLTNIPGGLETDTSSVDWVIDQYFADYGRNLTNGKKHEFESFTDQGQKLDYVITRLGMRGKESGEPNETDLLDAITLRSLHAVRWIEQKMKTLERGQTVAYDMYPTIDYWAVVDQATEAYLEQLITADYSDVVQSAEEINGSITPEWQQLYRLGNCAISKCVTPAVTRYVVKKDL